MKRQFLFFFALSGVLMLSGCIVNKLDNAHQIINLSKAPERYSISIEVLKGRSWSELMSAGPVKFNVLPQIVIWTETLKGELIETLYITGAHGVKFNHGKKGELGEAFYPASFPVWASRVKASGGHLPSKENRYTDAVTSATPTSSFTVHTSLKNGDQPVKMLLEINKSGDDNETYNKMNNDWIGQPSLIYEAEIPANPNSQTFVLNLKGHGGKHIDNPDIYTDLSGIDSALEQIYKASVSFR